MTKRRRNETRSKTRAPGGETSFGSLGVSVQPQKGSALLWPNVNDIGGDFRDAFHGSKVQDDPKEKLLHANGAAKNPTPIVCYCSVCVFPLF